ncbi:Type 4 prepilin-like proteins leader peptide-processing enzyme [Posidoniimonas polymericola]|uniref:Type 4 prepilin-like proteins leader peptide-processing enzyme n=1 Tax=Posidoniimonas polymericola TaxID=2528002 RepID=A0A5C5YSQ0_9BACT|nr:A24 family peptidase [Posidoniimonas polymericola]TWT77979.1 Type 4 prepilin-like proteins leader peptide-processing enzyme [Posidoniimonas polymericola]
MQQLMDVPLPLRLIVVALLGAVAGSLLNAAVYEFAYDRRRCSPWQPTPEGVGPRGWLDRLPVIGWLRLRRDAGVLGRGYWVRPLLLELMFAGAVAALYWWEVDRHMLIDPLLPVATPVDWRALSGVLHTQFFAHAVLAAFMWVGAWIDIDEKTIPDAVTWPGTFLGLLLITLTPLAALPQVVSEPVAPAVSAPLVTPAGQPVMDFNGDPFYVAPTQPFSPNDWPEWLIAPRSRWGIAVGLGCWWFWGLAIADRTWPRRLGRSNHWWAKLGVWRGRLWRDLSSFPLRNVLLTGTLLIAMVWFAGGAAWHGLLSGLIGLVLGCALVWAVRVVGSAAMGREAMGFGDVTLMMMIGVLVGWQACLAVFFLAPFAGLVLGLLSLILRRGDAIPYGPFLCLAAAFTVVFWGKVWPRAEVLFAAGWLVPIVLGVCIALLGLLLMLIQLAKRPFMRD